MTTEKKSFECLRRSLRTQGKPPVFDTKSRKDEISFKKWPRELGPIDMRASSCRSDEKLVKAIMESSGGGVRVEGWVDLKSMKLEEENIARVLPGRITTLKFFPCLHTNLIAVGNKFGNVGFWNLGDGIYVYYPHSGPVSGISILPFSISKIITSCYDGFIRLLDVEKEVFNLAYSSEHQVFCICRPCDDVNSLLFGEGYGTLGILDIRSGKPSLSWTLHADRINTIDFNSHNTNIMATSSTDGSVCIWDLRKLDTFDPLSIKTLKHKKPVHSAYFSPSGSLLATTSVDDTIGLLSGANYDDESMIHHYNHTSRWISSFRGVWGWDDSFIFVGNVKKGVDVICANERKVVTTLGSPHISAIPCRFDTHPLNPGMLAGSTGGGQVYVWNS